MELIVCNILSDDENGKTIGARQDWLGVTKLTFSPGILTFTGAFFFFFLRQLWLTTTKHTHQWDLLSAARIPAFLCDAPPAAVCSSAEALFFFSLPPLPVFIILLCGSPIYTRGLRV